MKYDITTLRMDNILKKTQKIASFDKSVNKLEAYALMIGMSSGRTTVEYTFLAFPKK